MFEFLKKIFGPRKQTAEAWLAKMTTELYSSDIKDFLKAVNPKDTIKLKKKFTLSTDPWKVEYEKTIKISPESNLDLNVKDEKGNTFLHYLGGKYFICPLSDYLLQKGADANALNNDGEPPLKYMVKNSKYGKKLIVSEPLAQATSKENLNKVYADGETILTSLLKNVSTQKEEVEAIIKTGVNVNTLNAQGQSPLGCLTEMLLNSEKYIADFYVPNTFLLQLNNSKIMWTNIFGKTFPEIATMLLQNGARLTLSESQKIVNTANELELNISKEDRHDGDFYFKSNHQRSAVIFGLAGLPKDYPLGADKAGQKLISRAKKGNIINTLDLFIENPSMEQITTQVRELILKKASKEKETASLSNQPNTAIKNPHSIASQKGYFKPDNQNQNQ